jgi:hypothetical protein
MRNILLSALLILVVLPLLGVMGAPLARYARATYGPPPTAVTPAPGMILMTEGPLEMQMTPLSSQVPTRADQHINLCVVGGPGVLDWQAILPIHDPQASRARPGTSFHARTGWMIHLWAGHPIGPLLFATERPGA